MRRLMLLALLALGLPAAALASSIDFNSGKFASGTISGTFSTMVKVSVVGSMNTVSIDTGKLSSASCPVSGAKCYSFSTGSVTVASGGSTVFTDSLSGGSVIKTGNAVAINAVLVPNSMVARGTTSFSFTFRGTSLTTGTAGVTGVAVPEPSTLGLLGTGLMGLVLVAKRKLKARGVNCC